jgi:hypothetical protein
MFKNIISIVLISIGLAMFFTFASPTYQDILAKRVDIASYREASINSRMLENERDKLTNKFNSINPYNIEKLQKMLPDSVDNIRLILELELLAQPYGMILKEVKYSTDKPDNTNTIQAGKTASAQQDYGVWDLGFSTQGTYQNFVNFVKDIENNLRMVDIVSVEFSTGTTDTKTNANVGSSEAYKYNIKIKTYWLKN